MTVYSNTGTRHYFYRNYYRIFLVVTVGISVVLWGCDFHPLYASRDGTGVAELARIRINPIGDRIGQILHNALFERMTPHSAEEPPYYVLSVKLDLSTKYRNFRKDNTASHADLWVSAIYQLQDLRRNAHPVVFKGTTRAAAGYNVLGVPYAIIVAEQAAQQQVAYQLAEKIFEHVVIYLLDHTPAASNRTRKIAPKATGRF